MDFCAGHLLNFALLIFNRTTYEPENWIEFDNMLVHSEGINAVSKRLMDAQNFLQGQR